ncbi:MAG: reverse transcriptase/maturase family protein [Candidatus Aenigmatarchaeota archaeon]
MIRDPKTRVISASDFRDRVVHHALFNIIEPIFEKTFIHDSYASRKNKGTHKAIERFDEFKRKTARNGKLIKNAKTNNIVIGYVLKADIKHYFDSVDHEVMINIIKKKISDKHVLWLVKKILDNHNTKMPCKGMPIGNLTSQTFANVYLNSLDYFVKQKLRARYYIRYLDDFVIFDRSKEKLEKYKNQISEFLKTIKLELHPNKSKIIPLHKGINFLGFRIFYYHKLLKKSNIRLFRKRTIELEKSYICGETSKDKLCEKINGWLEYARHGDTYKLRKRIQDEISHFLMIIKKKPQ